VNCDTHSKVNVSLGNAEERREVKDITLFNFKEIFASGCGNEGSSTRSQHRVPKSEISTAQEVEVVVYKFFVDLR
jgi:hypothetical protein